MRIRNYIAALTIFMFSTNYSAALDFRCGLWVEASKTDPEAYEMLYMYVSGVLKGAQYVTFVHTGEDPGPGEEVGPQSIKHWILNYCQQHPLDRNETTAQRSRLQHPQRDLKCLVIGMTDRRSVRDAAWLQEVLRISDTFGRWGGDEFLVVLPETDKAHAGEIAERLRGHGTYGREPRP